jgi:hypothetical protein
VLGSLLLTLTVSAVVLLAPVAIGLFKVSRHAHVAEADRSTRPARLAVAATLVGLGGLACAALLGTGAIAAAVVAAVLVGSVLAWSRLSTAWAVRGIVLWALLVTASAGFTGWLLHRAVRFSSSTTELLTVLAVWLLVVVALFRLRRYAFDRVAAVAIRGDDANEEEGSGPRRPLVTLAALVTAGGVAVALTSGGSGSPVGRPDPQAGNTGSSEGSREASRSDRSSSATSTTAGERSTPGAATGGGTTSRDRNRDGGSSTGVTETTGSSTGGSTPVPTVGINTAPASPTPTETTVEAKTPGWAKEKPNRPKDAPSPGPGGPSLP